ncbi:MAG: MFS transporter [Spirochaetales bacterium]|jgi:MFS family permease|nr:MFS transporter [Spirochaetales bacterium]
MPSNVRTGTNSVFGLSVFLGSCGTVWLSTFTPDGLFGVFFRNHIGATSTQLGILAAIVQAMAITNLLSIFIYRKLANRKIIFTCFLGFHRLLGLVPAAIAFTTDAIPASVAIRAVSISMGLSWACLNIGTAGWSSWIADLIPESSRIAFFMKRSAIINIINVCWLFAAPAVIDMVPASLTLQAYGFSFLVSSGLGVATVVFYVRMPRVPAPPAEQLGIALFFEPLRNKDFLRFCLSVGLVIFSVTIFNPFILPFLTSPYGVNMPETMIGIRFLISGVLWTAVIPFWGVVMTRFGRKPVIILCALSSLSWLGYFFITSQNYMVIVPLTAAFAGALAPGFWEGIFQMMLTLAPEKNRISYISWYLALTGAVSAGGPLLGGMLDDILGSFYMPFGRGMALESFHLVMLVSLAIMTVSLLVFVRVREGSEQPLGVMVSNIARPGIFRTYASMGTIVRSGSPAKVTKALRSITRKTDSIAFTDVSSRLEDPDPDVREEAVRALGRIGTVQAVEVLISVLIDDESSDRISAARSLGEIGDPRAVPYLIDGISSVSEDLQDACIRALGKIPSGDSFSPLLQVIKNVRSERIAVSGAEAASRLGFLEAAWEIFPRMHSTMNPILRRQLFIAMGNLAGTPGEFYQYVAGGVSQQKNKIEKLFHSASQAATAILKKKIPSINKEIKEAVRLFKEASFSQALEHILTIEMKIIEPVIGKFNDPVAVVERAFRKNEHMGLWVWLITEIAKIQLDLEPKIAEFDVLLLFHFLSACTRPKSGGWHRI